MFADHKHSHEGTPPHPAPLRSCWSSAFNCDLFHGFERLKITSGVSLSTAAAHTPLCHAVPAATTGSQQLAGPRCGDASAGTAAEPGWQRPCQQQPRRGSGRSCCCLPGKHGVTVRSLQGFGLKPFLFNSFSLEMGFGEICQPRALSVPRPECVRVACAEVLQCFSGRRGHRSLLF